MDTTRHLTSCIETCDRLLVCIEYVTLYVYADTAHRMVGRRSEETDTKLRIIEVIGVGLVGAVLVLLTVADQCRELLLADILWLCALMVSTSVSKPSAFSTSAISPMVLTY